MGEGRWRSGQVTSPLVVAGILIGLTVMALDIFVGIAGELEELGIWFGKAIPLAVFGLALAAGGVYGVMRLARRDWSEWGAIVAAFAIWWAGFYGMIRYARLRVEAVPATRWLDDAEPKALRACSPRGQKHRIAGARKGRRQPMSIVGSAMACPESLALRVLGGRTKVCDQLRSCLELAIERDDAGTRKRAAQAGIEDLTVLLGKLENREPLSTREGLSMLDLLSRVGVGLDSILPVTPDSLDDATKGELQAMMKAQGSGWCFADNGGGPELDSESAVKLFLRLQAIEDLCG